MIEVCHIDALNIDTGDLETLHITSSPDFIANGYAYLPVLSDMFDFNQSLFDRGTTQGSLTVGIGTITVTNIDGNLDKYRRYGFDGRTISIYRPLDKNTPITDITNLFFTGVIAYVQFAWSTITFFIKSRMEVLNIPMQPNGFLGTNLGTGGSGGYEGSSGLVGKTKPQIFGRCMSVEGAPINEFFLLYAFNYDRTGAFAPIYRFYDVFVKGVRYTAGVDYATADLLIAADLTVLPAGKYVTCLASGLFRLSSVPASNGKVVANLADASDYYCTAAQVTARILQQNASFISGVDYAAAELADLDSLNTSPVGIAIADNTTIADAMNQILDSITAWVIPDAAGVFHFGYIDYPDSLIAAGKTSLCTITKRQWSDTIERVAVEDQAQNIPAYSVELQHTKNWAVQGSGELADSVGVLAREFFTKEYRSARAFDLSIFIAHPLAPSLKYNTLLNGQLYLPLLNTDFSVLLSDPTNGWTLAGAGAVATQSVGRVTVTPNGAATANIVQQLLYNDSISGGTIEIGFTLTAGSSVAFKVTRGIANTVVLSETISSSASDQYIVRTITVPYSNSPANWNIKIQFTTISISAAFTLGDVFVRAAQQGLTPYQVAQSKLSIQAALQERYVLTIPQKFYMDNGIGIGKIITLQDNARFGLVNGKAFLVIGADPSDIDYTVTIDVWRVEAWHLPTIS